MGLAFPLIIFFSCFHYHFFPPSLRPSSIPLSALGQKAVTGCWTIFPRLSCWTGVLTNWLAFSLSLSLEWFVHRWMVLSRSGQYKYSRWPAQMSSTHRISEMTVRSPLTQSPYFSWDKCSTCALSNSGTGCCTVQIPKNLCTCTGFIFHNLEVDSLTGGSVYLDAALRASMYANFAPQMKQRQKWNRATDEPITR